MTASNPADTSLTRRDLLKAGSALAVAASVPAVATAQTPKRGGTLRLTFQADPLHFDPHQTLSFVPTPTWLGTVSRTWLMPCFARASAIAS